MLAQRGDGGRGEHDLALALRLRRRHHDLVVGVGALLGDGERAGIEVDVLPAQPGQLATAHAGVQGEDPQRGEAVVADMAEERGRLVAGPHRQLGVLDAGRSGAAGRVDRDQVPAHGIGKGAVQHSVGVLHRPDRQRASADAAVVEQRAVPGLDLHRRQLDESLAAEVWLDPAPDHVAVAGPRRDGELVADALDPEVEERAERLA